MTSIRNFNGTKVNIACVLATALDDLDSCPGGAFATVHDYASGTPGKDKCIRSKVSTINFISKFHYKRVVAKWLDAARKVEASSLTLDPKAAAKFDDAKAELIASYERTLGLTDKPVNEGHRAGHVRCYVHTSTGIKCHLVTEYDKELKCMVPVLAENGLPTVKSIMVSVLQRSQTVHDKGEYKPTKHQWKTVAKNAIEAVAHKVAPPFKMLSLKADNFSSLTIGGEVVTPEDLDPFAGLLVEEGEEVEV